MKLVSISIKRYINMYIISQWIAMFFILFFNTTSARANALSKTKFLRQIWYELSIGGGIDFYKTNVNPNMQLTNQDGYFFVEENDENNNLKNLLIAQWPSGPLISRFTDNKPTLHPPTTALVNTFKTTGAHIPISLLFMINFAKLRIGIGTGINLNFLFKNLTYQKNKNTLKEQDQNNQANAEEINFTIQSKKMYTTFYPTLLLGCILKECKNHTFLFSAQWTPIFCVTKSINTNLFLKLLHFQVPIITWEKHLSPYCKLATKLGYHTEYSTTTLNDIRTTHWKNSISLHFGISLRVPDFPQCHYKQCRVKRNHKHNGKTFSRFYIM